MGWCDQTNPSFRLAGPWLSVASPRQPDASLSSVRMSGDGCGGLCVSTKICRKLAPGARLCVRKALVKPTPQAKGGYERSSPGSRTFARDATTAGTPSRESAEDNLKLCERFVSSTLPRNAENDSESWRARVLQAL